MALGECGSPDVESKPNPKEASHQDNCQHSSFEQTSVDELSAVQFAALEFVSGTAHILSEKARACELQNRAKMLGYDQHAVDAALRYIRDDAPIIVHFSMRKTFKHLVRDTHYRNQFETHRSGGTLSQPLRKEWESRMFGGYYDSATGFERVKYAALNFSRDPYGVASCFKRARYGKCFLLIKDKRNCCTIAARDTGSAGGRAPLGTCSDFAHILASGFSDVELCALFRIATGQQKWQHSSTLDKYKEVQIHGPLRLDQHVAAVVVHPKYRKRKKFVALLKMFTEKNKACRVVWMDDPNWNQTGCTVV